MYGSIMRGRIKTGRREEFERLMCELSLAHVADERGLHCVELAWEDEDSNRVVMILHFEDRQSYVRNTEHNRSQSSDGLRRRAKRAPYQKALYLSRYPGASRRVLRKVRGGLRLRRVAPADCDVRKWICEGQPAQYRRDRRVCL